MKHDLAKKIYEENRNEDCYPDPFEEFAESSKLFEYLDQFFEPYPLPDSDYDYLHFEKDDKTDLEYLGDAKPGDLVWDDGEFLCDRKQVESYRESEWQSVQDCFIGSMEGLIKYEIALHQFDLMKE